MPATPEFAEPGLHMISVRCEASLVVLPWQACRLLRREYAAAVCCRRRTAKCLLAADVAGAVTRKAGCEPGGRTAGDDRGGSQ